MKHRWLYICRDDIETEWRQCAEEGRNLASVKQEFDQVRALDLENLSNQNAAQLLLDRTIELPLHPEYSYSEPDDLQGIRASRPQTDLELEQFPVTEDAFLNKVHSAWTGRVAGCLLGKPVEGWSRAQLRDFLQAADNWPLNRYLRFSDGDRDTLERNAIAAGNAGDAFVDQVEERMPRAAPPDDDTNYTTLALALLEHYGPEFTPQNVADFWLGNLPLLPTCTAERVAYRNFSNLIPPPASARFRNPYREWIGAQIRADFWGYVNPGNPERAAEMAWRDASISHVKNGIYGAMWVAAMIAASFATDDIETIIRAGIGEIPERSRLTAAIKEVLNWHRTGLTYEEAVEKIHSQWDESLFHHWCHTISNAMIVAVALLWGEGDFGKSICLAVQASFDTDCNGATVGSIIGILNGRKHLPEQWTNVFEDRLQTSVNGYHLVELSEMARKTVELSGCSQAASG